MARIAALNRRTDLRAQWLHVAIGARRGRSGALWSQRSIRWAQVLAALGGTGAAAAVTASAHARARETRCAPESVPAPEFVGAVVIPRPEQFETKRRALIAGAAPQSVLCHAAPRASVLRAALL
eukprot:SAG11_NODE_1928_length_4053_cov_6.814112_4_plen_124_part_00